MSKEKEIVKQILDNAHFQLKTEAKAFAPTNIALCKYWGKRDKELNLPTNSSLSISLDSLGTATEIYVSEKPYDEVFLDNHRVSADSNFMARVMEFVDLLRPSPSISLTIKTYNAVPTAAGLASSASGFAALILALNDLFGYRLSSRELSIIARLGSGSAARSIYDGFVVWNKGVREDGMDSYVTPLKTTWPEFCIGILTLSKEKKPISSRKAMNQTVATSPLYKEWPSQAEKDLETMISAIESKDFKSLGEAVEQNSFSMHATMMSAFPPIIYMKPETISTISWVHQLRRDGVEVYITMDAGPNVKLIFLEKDAQTIQMNFPKIKIIKPFK
jgi:diphosphomevalonate decarboxylase